MFGRFATTSALIVAAAVPTSLVAQATATPSFNAPYRAFTRHEFGGTVSFPEGGGTAIEGQYRFGYRQFDVGIRGGMHFIDVVADRILLGIEGRARAITHTAQFPLDGAVVFGAGVNITGGTSFIAPIGLSLGRRLELEDSNISIVPYVQPTGFLSSSPDPFGGRDTDANFAVGFGADFRLSAVFDARLSVGLGDLEGVSISAVWLR